jgi:hypothetical protein
MPSHCYDLAIDTEASRVDSVCAKTAWAALIQDYKAYKAAERGVKVFIKAVVKEMWIRDLCNPKTFYSNVTALAIFDHTHEHFSSLHVLDMVSLTILMSQYYESMPDISEYIFLLEDAQRKDARARLPVTNQTLTVLFSTALLATNTFPHTTKLREELDPANKTWAAWKTAYPLVPTRRGPNASVPLEGLTIWAEPTQPTPPPSTLAFWTPLTLPLTTLPVLPPMQRPSLSNLSPLPHLLPPPTSP